MDISQESSTSDSESTISSDTEVTVTVLSETTSSSGSSPCCSWASPCENSEFASDDVVDVHWENDDDDMEAAPISETAPSENDATSSDDCGDEDDARACRDYGDEHVKLPLIADVEVMGGKNASSDVDELALSGVVQQFLTDIVQHPGFVVERSQHMQLVPTKSYKETYKWLTVCVPRTVHANGIPNTDSFEFPGFRLIRFADRVLLVSWCTCTDERIRVQRLYQHGIFSTMNFDDVVDHEVRLSWTCAHTNATLGASGGWKQLAALCNLVPHPVANSLHGFAHLMNVSASTRQAFQSIVFVVARPTRGKFGVVVYKDYKEEAPINTILYKCVVCASRDFCSHKTIVEEGFRKHLHEGGEGVGPARVSKAAEYEKRLFRYLRADRSGRALTCPPQDPVPWHDEDYRYMRPEEGGIDFIGMDAKKYTCPGVTGHGACGGTLETLENHLYVPVVYQTHTIVPKVRVYRCVSCGQKWLPFNVTKDYGIINFDNTLMVSVQAMEALIYHKHHGGMSAHCQIGIQKDSAGDIG